GEDVLEGADDGGAGESELQLLRAAGVPGQNEIRVVDVERVRDIDEELAVERRTMGLEDVEQPVADEDGRQDDGLRRGGLVGTGSDPRLAQVFGDAGGPRRGARTEHDVVAGLREEHREAYAHAARSENANLFHGCSLLQSSMFDLLVGRHGAQKNFSRRGAAASTAARWT